MRGPGPVIEFDGAWALGHCATHLDMDDEIIVDSNPNLDFSSLPDLEMPHRPAQAGTGRAQGRHSLAQSDTRDRVPGPEPGVPEIDSHVEGGVDEKTKKRSFVFTINNPKLDVDELIEAFRNLKAVALVFQYEVGENGTPHYQGWVRFKNARLYGGLCTEFSGWFRPCKSDIASRKYCSKQRTRITGPHGFGCDEAKAEIVTIKEEDFYPWEVELTAKLRGAPDPREIIWIWSDGGNVGKSAYCKWLVKHLRAYEFSGKAADIKGALADLDEGGKPIPPVLVWDIPRCHDNHLSWAALEEVKNGLFFSPKFHGRMVVYNPVHVVVFCNFPPMYEKLSADRWSYVRCLDP